MPTIQTSSPFTETVLRSKKRISVHEKHTSATLVEALEAIANVLTLAEVGKRARHPSLASALSLHADDCYHGATILGLVE